MDFRDHLSTSYPTPLRSISQPIIFEIASLKSNNTAADDTVFKAQITWIPNNVGQENVFNLKFIDPSSGREIKGILYDIMVFRNGEHLAETHRSNQQSASQKYIFPERGYYNLKITNIGGTTASIDLPIHVVPEFSNTTIFGLLAGLMVTVIYMTRIKLVHNFSYQPSTSKKPI